MSDLFKTWSNAQSYSPRHDSYFAARKYLERYSSKFTMYQYNQGIKVPFKFSYVDMILEV